MAVGDRQCSNRSAASDFTQLVLVPTIVHSYTGFIEAIDKCLSTTGAQIISQQRRRSTSRSGSGPRLLHADHDPTRAARLADQTVDPRLERRADAIKRQSRPCR